MFPEITRDEVFRIETARLWLRWPTLADAAAFADVLATGCRQTGSRVAFANADAVKTLIGQWRAEMEAGLGLHLAVVPKAGPRLPIGMVHLSPTRPARLAPASGLGEAGSEAVQALTAMADLLGVGPAQDWSPRTGTLSLGGLLRQAPLASGFCR